MFFLTFLKFQNCIISLYLLVDNKLNYTPFDWFLLMTYWRTDTKMMSPATTFFSFSFIKYIHLVPCYCGSVNLESNSSQKTPKCLGLEYQWQTWPCYVQLSFLHSCFLPHFDITWDISLNIKLCTTTWHLFFKYIRFLCCILTQPPDVSCFFSVSCYHSTFPNFNSS